MSRSNPEILQNPSNRWFEWDGEHGKIRYYDKEQQENIEVSIPFSFLVLDQLGTVKGWHNESESGIYANEVHRIDRQPLTVKSFEGGVIAEGLYKNIKDTVKAKGGRYVSSIYIAYYMGDSLAIGNISLKGAALSAWMDFTRKIGKEIYEKAVVIDGAEEGSKGSITYYTPTFSLRDIKDSTNETALELDHVLQEYLDKKQSDPVEKEEPTGTPPPNEANEQPPMPTEETGPESLYAEPDDEDILPF